jgi:hypothetical protein
MTAAIAGMGSVSLEYHEERRALTDTEALGNCSCSRHSSTVDSSVSCLRQLNFLLLSFLLSVLRLSGHSHELISLASRIWTCAVREVEGNRLEVM